VFEDTHWSLILEAAQTQAPGAQSSLADLLQRYWSPLYHYVRRSGASHHDAQDLVQGFFLQFLERRAINRADPRRGKFRTFLLTSLKNYMSTAHDRARAEKRGGRCHVVPLDDEEKIPEQLADAHGLNPEEEFEKLWALAVVEAATQRIRRAYEMRQRAPLFDALQGSVFGDDDAPRYQKIAAEMKISLDTVKTEVVRIRREFRASLRREVATGLDDPREVDDELRYLRRTLAFSR
jgi:RNA polymerase sigma-70 factor (ECF subfamily)